MKVQKLLSLIRQSCERYEMIEEGDKIAVGVSGGKDSLVTLTALARLSKFYQKPFKVAAITVETGVPGMRIWAMPIQILQELKLIVKSLVWNLRLFIPRSGRSSWKSERNTIPVPCVQSFGKGRW